MAIVCSLLVPITASAQCNDYPDYALTRGITACGVTMNIGMEEGFGTYNLSLVNNLTKLVEFKKTFNLPDDSPLLCQRAYLAFPAFFGWFKDQYISWYYPRGWPGMDAKPRKMSK
jgi:hypothetical protein